MNLVSISEELKGNTYPGRGIIMGKTADGKAAVTAYFIMGRSKNSRNRIFTHDGSGIRTEAFNAAELLDPSLIIYSPVMVLGNATIVTNGDQTETIYQYMSEGKSFEEALRSRKFEPDAPNFTPRVSGIIIKNGCEFSYKLSILKSANGNPASCERFFYEYECPINGEGRFIHTYNCDGNPIPSYDSEPTPVIISGDIEHFTSSVWESLDSENKVSLFVRYIPLDGQPVQTKIINKNV
ncbi:MAG: IMP cyclohydrolase [Oscillospiraceae bacterium]